MGPNINSDMAPAAAPLVERALIVALSRRHPGGAAQGDYRVGYMAHNHHFLWAAGVDGRLPAGIPGVTPAPPSCSSTPCRPTSRWRVSGSGRPCRQTRARPIRWRSGIENIDPSTSLVRIANLTLRADIA
jgi:hypothetical protein